MRFLRIFFVALLFVLVFAGAVSVSAQTPPSPTPTPTPNLQGGQGDLTWTIDGKTSEAAYVDGNNTSVTIQFTGLQPNDDLWLFPKTKQEDVKNAKKLTKVKSDGSGNYSIKVCGAGDNALKGSPIGKACRDDGKDYFHEGNIYRLGLYDDEDGLAQIMVAQFYVYHSAPIIKISHVQRGNLPGVKVELAGRRPGDDNKNNYQVIVKQGDTDKRDLCTTVKNKDQKTLSMLPDASQKDFTTPIPAIQGNPASVTLGPTNTTGFAEGEYTLKINSRNHDEGLFGTGIGSESCSGGFTYYEFEIDLSRTGIKVLKASPDPDDIDGLNTIKLSFTSPAPCAKITGIPNKGGKTTQTCAEVRTAIGTINVTVSGFVKSLFEFILMLATFGGIIIIIYAGYIMIMSRGDKEKLAASRETLTSAIVGLLFIILSIVILEIIGVDILRIPGFGR